MAFLSDSEKQNIAEAIAAAERKTSGELVTVIARAADSYLFVALLWPALIALVLPGILLSLPAAWLPHWLANLSAIQVYNAQAGLFIVLALIMMVPRLRLLVVPKSLKQRRSHRLARQQFVEQGLYLTRERTGVLIFVSVAEHYVEIIADAGIDAKVPEGAWDGMVADFIAQVRAGKVADGFLATVTATSDLLAEHFPHDGGGENELPNHLIEL